MKAYKFINQRFLLSTLGGAFRIGTVAEFRVPDGKSGGRADVSETSHKWSPAEETTVSKGHPFVEMAGVKSVTIGSGGSLTVRRNGYLFCMSNRYSVGLHEKMTSEFGADVCLEIQDVELFIKELTTKMALKLHPVIKDVRYRIKEDNSDYQHPDPFSKPSEYAWQNELRSFWEAGPFAVPIFLSSPEAARLIKVVPKNA